MWFLLSGHYKITEKTRSANKFFCKCQFMFSDQNSIQTRIAIPIMNNIHAAIRNGFLSLSF